MSGARRCVGRPEARCGRGCIRVYNGRTAADEREAVGAASPTETDMASPLMELVVENVRSFVGRHTVPIHPLTLLVGENSSGKTTLLAALSAVCDPAGFPLRPRFNEPPYSLGTFETIATYKGGRYARASTFSLGFTAVVGRRDEPAQVSATYGNRAGQPDLADVRAERGGDWVHLVLGAGGSARDARIEFAARGTTSSYAFTADEITDARSRPDISTAVAMSLFRMGRFAKAKERDLVWDAVDMLSMTPLDVALSIAPIRTRPRRTYDEATEEFTPEGAHVPFILSNQLASNGQSEELSGALEEYGSRSGLFKHIDVKRLGSKPGDPFQILVTGSGRPSNLIDVGYGVSQALPVVVQVVQSPPGRLLLMQQPEVHLHPRAQAELGSFFVDQVYAHDRKMVVETHSDYIVDRVRQEVARRSLDPVKVSILYLEKHRHETTIFPLRLDEQGNILDAPPSYREFFLREEMNLLSRTDG